MDEDPTRALESGLTVVAVLVVAGCSHYWERPGGVVAAFERESAARVEDAKQSPYGPDSLETISEAAVADERPALPSGSEVLARV